MSLEDRDNTEPLIRWVADTNDELEPILVEVGHAIHEIRHIIVWGTIEKADGWEIDIRRSGGVGGKFVLRRRELKKYSVEEWIIYFRERLGLESNQLSQQVGPCRAARAKSNDPSPGGRN